MRRSSPAWTTSPSQGPPPLLGGARCWRRADSTAGDADGHQGEDGAAPSGVEALADDDAAPPGRSRPRCRCAVRRGPVPGSGRCSAHHPALAGPRDAELALVGRHRDRAAPRPRAAARRRCPARGSACPPGRSPCASAVEGERSARLAYQPSPVDVDLRATSSGPRTVGEQPDRGSAMTRLTSVCSATKSRA